MSELSDTHNIQLTNLEILVLKYILKNLDVDLKLNFFKDGKKISFPNVIDGFVQKLKRGKIMNKKYRPFKTYDEFNDFLDTCSYLRETYISNC